MTFDKTQAAQWAALSRNLHAEPDLAHVMARAASTVAAVAGCGSVAVNSTGKNLSVGSRVATDPIAAAADRLQDELGEGPSFLGTWDGPHLSIGDLRQGATCSRWARRVVDELRIHAVLSVRLYTHDRTVGTLTLYSTQTHAFTVEDVSFVDAVAAHTAVAMARTVDVENLHEALTTRTLIARAVGLLMREHRMSAEAALALLQRMSSVHNRKMRLIAEELLSEHDQQIHAEQHLDSVRRIQQLVRPRKLGNTKKATSERD